MNPILDFGIDKSTRQYVGYDLQRPECILAEPDGVLWSADARGGVMRIAPDGTQSIVTQKRSQHFQGAGSAPPQFSAPASVPRSPPGKTGCRLRR
jgi:gluconolactonase